MDLKLFFSVLAAIIGIGGAYATSHSSGSARVGTIFNWYTVNGQFVFTGTVSAAMFMVCPLTGNCVCMKGTAGAKRITFFHPCH